MADLTLHSYELNGKKLSFANWISNLSPTDTPFSSMTGKEAIQQTLYQWQTDTLAKVNADNAQKEGDEAVEESRKSTIQKSNVTQILRKVVKVSDTANALANYGRGQELQYQMEKAGKEIKRDLERSFLSKAQARVDGSSTVARQFDGFYAQVSKVADTNDTGAVVYKNVALTEAALFDLTENLYIAGSHASIIMFHPSHAKFFSSLMEHVDAAAETERRRMFKGADTKLNVYVSEIVDPLGQRYTLIPNRFMDTDVIYFFRPEDWTQMVLRAPERTQLAKDGSYEKWMIEMEVGLRHRNPFASGIIEIPGGTAPTTPTISGKTVAGKVGGNTVQFADLFTATNSHATDYTYAVNPVAAGTVNAAGVLTLADTASGTVTVVATNKTTATVTATATLNGVTPKLTGISVAVDAADSTKGTLAADTLTLNATTDAVHLNLTGAPAGAVIPAGATAVSATPASVTATIAGNVVTVTGVIAAPAPGIDVTITSGTVTKVIHVVVPAAPAPAAEESGLIDGLSDAKRARKAQTKAAAAEAAAE